MKEDIKFIAQVIIRILIFVGFIAFLVGYLYVCFKNDRQKEKLKLIEEHERLHDREILRSMHAKV